MGDDSTKNMIEFATEPRGKPALVDVNEVTMVLSDPPSPNGKGTGMTLRGGGMIIVSASYEQVRETLLRENVRIGVPAYSYVTPPSEAEVANGGLILPGHGAFPQ